VAPFCELLHEASPLAPRLLLNREKVGERAAGGREAGFRFDDIDNYRDAALLMSCDQGVALLARHLGWEQDLEALVKAAGCKAQSPLLPPVAAEGAAVEMAETAEEVAAAMGKQWRRPKPSLPPLRPLDPLDAPLPVSGFSCSLLEPAGGLADVEGGAACWFRVGVHGEGAFEARAGNDQDYIGLYQKGATLPRERTDGDRPFVEPSPAGQELRAEIADAEAAAKAPVEVDEVAEGEWAAVAEDGAVAGLSARHERFAPPFAARALRLRVPWVRFELPFDLEVRGRFGASLEVFGETNTCELEAADTGCAFLCKSGQTKQGAMGTAWW